MILNINDLKLISIIKMLNYLNSIRLCRTYLWRILGSLCTLCHWSVSESLGSPAPPISQEHRVAGLFQWIWSALSCGVWVTPLCSEHLPCKHMFAIIVDISSTYRCTKCFGLETAVCICGASKKSKTIFA